MMQRVEPYIAWGYPNHKTVKELIYKRGYGKVAPFTRHPSVAYMAPYTASSQALSLLRAFYDMIMPLRDDWLHQMSGHSHYLPMDPAGGHSCELQAASIFVAS